ncbi:MAG: hypothetical protein KY469_10060 [Actinobacteria bacterium]|nr:hypothetical protein [Actinomycetota bacterium]
MRHEPQGRYVWVIVLTLLGLLGTAPATDGSGSAIGASAAASSSADRLYLLESADGTLTWSVDATDPELGTHPIRRLCGYYAQHATQRRYPCLGGYGHVFTQGSLLDTPANWTVEEPLRFHLELDVASPDEVDVTLEVQDEAHISEAGTATEVAPGVWEGEIAPYEGLFAGRETVFVLRATPRTLAGTGVHVDLTLGGRGRSYIEVPAPVPARSVPQLLAADTHAPVRSSFAGGRWELAFNDDDWVAHAFEGDVTERRAFPFPVAAHATSILSWVDVFDAPPVHGLARGRLPDSRQLTDDVSLDLIRDGERVEGIQVGAGSIGTGYASLAAADVAPGVLELEVTPRPNAQDSTYTVHVVVIHGERTLRQIHATVPGDTSARTPSVGVCRGGGIVFTVSPAVTTYRLDLDWDSYSLVNPGWTPAFDSPMGAAVCGSTTNGDRVRLTFRQHGVTGVGAHPTVDSDYVSIYDTVFAWTIDFTHSPPPV